MFYIYNIHIYIYIFANYCLSSFCTFKKKIDLPVYLCFHRSKNKVEILMCVHFYSLSNNDAIFPSAGLSNSRLGFDDIFPKTCSFCKGMYRHPKLHFSLNNNNINNKHLHFEHEMLRFLLL